MLGAPPSTPLRAFSDGDSGRSGTRTRTRRKLGVLHRGDADPRPCRGFHQSDGLSPCFPQWLLRISPHRSELSRPTSRSGVPADQVFSVELKEVLPDELTTSMQIHLTPLHQDHPPHHHNQ